MSGRTDGHDTLERMLIRSRRSDRQTAADDLAIRTILKGAEHAVGNAMPETDPLHPGRLPGPSPCEPEPLDEEVLEPTGAIR